MKKPVQPQLGPTKTKQEWYLQNNISNLSDRAKEIENSILELQITKLPTTSSSNKYNPTFYCLKYFEVCV